jgi:hypothetical protein
MIIKEAKIMVCNRGKYKDLSVRFLIKPEDYNSETYEQLMDWAIEGTVGALVFEPFDANGQPAPVKNDFYSNFRAEVMRDFGIEAYNGIKSKLSIGRLKDLEMTQSPSEAESILLEALLELKMAAGFFDGHNN